MRKLIYSVAIVVILSIVACMNSEKPSTTAIDSISNSEAAVVYSCPMHPEVKSDKPGTCHICNMDLVKTEGSEMQPNSNHQGHSH